MKENSLLVSEYPSLNEIYNEANQEEEKIQEKNESLLTIQTKFSQIFPKL